MDTLPTVEVDVYKKIGQGFGAVGGGVMYPLTDSLLVQGNLGIMFFFPTTGFVLEPSLGLVLSL